MSRMVHRRTYEALVKDFIRAIESDLDDWSTAAYRLLS
jgi:hypothetical protein